MTLRPRYVVLAILIALPLILAALLLAPLLEYRRVQSPDGAFTAVARTQPFWSFIPVMPGGGGDKPARVTLYKGDASCGSAWIAMASMIFELRWDLDQKPRSASVVATANWNLDACSVEVYPRD